MVPVLVEEYRNPNRTYSAGDPFNSLNQINGPEEDAYSRQKTHDDLNLTLTERGYRQTRSIPVPDI